MNASILRHGLFVAAVTLLPLGCASIVFPLQQEKRTEQPRMEEQQIRQKAEALAQYSMAILEREEGHDDEALNRFAQAVSNDPQNVTLRLELAVAYLRHNRLDDLQTLLDGIIKDDPKVVRAWQLKALAFRVNGQHREALAPLDMAIKLEPNEGVHYLEAASIHMRLKEHEQAIRVLEEGLAKADDRLPLLQALGEYYIAQAALVRSKQRNASLPKTPLATLEAAVEEFPADPYLLTQYGDLLILHQNIEQAIDVFGRIEALNPEDLMIRQKLALNLAAVGNREKAIELLEALAETSPNAVRIRFYIAELYEQDKQPEQAIATYTKILEVNPALPEAYIKLAFLLINRQEIEQATLLLERGRNELPDDSRLIEMLGYAHAADKRYADAIAGYEQVETITDRDEKNPLMSHFYLNYAVARQLTGSPEEAVRLIRKDLTTDPDAIDDYMSIVLRSQNSPEVIALALPVLEQLSDVFPSEISSRTMYGLIAFQADEHAVALEQFELAYAMAEDEQTTEDLSAQFFFWMGAAAERVKEYDQAESYFLLAISRQPDHAEAHNYLAYMHADRGVKLEMALEHVEVALAIDPDNAAYLDTRGWIYYHMGKYEDALVDIQTAMELIGEDPTIADHLGDILLALERSAEAIPWWNKALELDPENERIREKIEAHSTPETTP